MIRFTGNVTWTMRTLAALLAAKLKCNVDVLRIMFQGLPTKSLDFVAEFQEAVFEVKFHACIPGYVFCDAVETFEVLHKERGKKPAHEGCVRFIARHPAMKVVRTAAVPMASTVAAVVRILFPDICSSVTWTVHLNGAPISTETRVTGCFSFVIEWDCFKPLATTDVCSARFVLPVDTAQTQMKFHASKNRWIRSPFKAQPQILRTDESAQLMQLAASFVSHSQLDVNLTCHVGGSLVDPSLTLSDIPVSEVVSFKLAPLLGGMSDGLDGKEQSSSGFSSVGSPDVDVPVDDVRAMSGAEGVVRYVAYHPLMKVVRTAIVSTKSTFGDVVRTLFPDVANMIACVRVDNVVVLWGDCIAICNCMEIEWNDHMSSKLTEVQLLNLALPG